MALTTKHLFPFLKLMRALNIKDDFKAIYRNKSQFENMTEEEIAAQVDERGIDLIFMLMEKFPNAEKEIKAFLCIYADKTAEEMEELPVEEFFALIRQFLKEPAFKSFFSQAVK
jgi:hypothetical protein